MGQSSSSLHAMAGVLILFLVLSFARGAYNGRLFNFMKLFGLFIPDEEQVCRSDVCVDTAKKLMASMNESIDPCEDFYGFACSGWIQNHPIPPTSVRWSQFQVLNKNLDLKLHKLLSEGVKEEDEDSIKSIKMIYEACMDEERIEGKGTRPLLDLLNDLNGWPLLSPDVLNSNIHWQETAVLVTKKIGIAPVLAVGVDVDLRNTSRSVITIEQPEPSTPVYYFRDPDFIKTYEDYLTDIVRLLRNRRRSVIPFSIVRSQIREVIKFEESLAELTKQKQELKILDKLHNRVSIRQLQKWTNKAIRYRRTMPVDWKSYLQDLLDKDDSEINDDTRVVVSDWNFLKELFRLIDTTYSETVVNFILWEVVQTMSRETNKKMRRMDFNFKMQVSGVEEDTPRWEECVHATDSLEFALGYMYVKKYFSKESKAKAIEIVENIRREFRRGLSEVTWIDEETKKAALEKADFMNTFIGYPSWYGNDTILSRYYKDLKIGKDHFANMIALRKFLVKKYLGKLDKRTSRDEWITGPAQINAYYDPRLNSITFPAGILEPPFFNKDQPDALNYGSIGSIIGHEVTHAFDDIGRQGDKFGNINQWWTKETEETYFEKAKCFVEDYSKYVFPSLENMTESEPSVNGLLTLGENIADNGGLATALRAYLKHQKRDEKKLPGLEKYTHEQLFYLGFATTWCETTTEPSLLNDLLDDSHSPNHVRVLGSVSNSEHFAKTWGCVSGSEMNPVDKCRLW